MNNVKISAMYSLTVIIKHVNSQRAFVLSQNDPQKVHRKRGKVASIFLGNEAARTSNAFRKTAWTKEK